MLEIKNICKQLNLTQAQLSDILGISKRSLNYRLDGDQKWTINEIIKIAELCDDEIAIQSGINTYSIKINKL